MSTVTHPVRVDATPPRPGAPAVEVSQLTKAYGRHVAVDRIDLRIDVVAALLLAAPVFARRGIRHP